jgi:hypothetical protein
MIWPQGALRLATGSRSMQNTYVTPSSSQRRAALAASVVAVLLVAGAASSPAAAAGPDASGRAEPVLMKTKQPCKRGVGNWGRPIRCKPVGVGTCKKKPCKKSAPAVEPIPFKKKCGRPGCRKKPIPPTCKHKPCKKSTDAGRHEPA